MNTNTQTGEGQVGYKYGDYNSFYRGYANVQTKSNFLEITTVFLAIISLLAVLIWGIFSQSNKNRDTQREIDIQNVIKATNDFYENSSTIPSKKSYPITQCSELLNEVDFEYTLKEHLTGSKKQIDTHQYIKKSDFPSDKWGVYSNTPNSRKTPLRDCPKIFANTPNSSSNIYSDGAKSCNFSSKNKAYLNCYLYTSSNNGDKYQIAYYSQDRGYFVVYSKFRDDNTMVEIVSL